MKRKIFYYIALCAIIMLYSCSDEDILYDADGLSDGNNIYITLTMSMTSSSASTRSTTDTSIEDLAQGNYTSSSSGTVDVEDLESTVKGVIIALVRNNGTLEDRDARIDKTLYVKSSPEAQGNGTYKLTFSVTEEEFNDFLSDFGTNDNELILFLNPQDELLESEISLGETYTLKNTNDNSLFDESQLPMASALRCNIYNNQSKDPNDHMSEATAYDLGSVMVERSVARFDYKDGSLGGDYSYSLNDGTTVQLQSLALVNMVNRSYYLRHNAAGPNNPYQTGNEWYLYGPEIDMFYRDLGIDQDGFYSSVIVADSYYYIKFGYYCYAYPDNINIDKDYRDNLFYNLNTPSSWKFTKFSDLTASSKHNGYNTWRYSTENCPADYKDQLKGNSEGVVFKAQIIGNDKKFDGASKIYVFKDKLYGTWDDVATATASSNSLKTAYDNVMDVWTEGKDENDEDVVQAMADNGFTGYTPDEDGNYYMYYYYWNRHNDKSVPGYTDEGIPFYSQFAVVRNNVYGLSVTSITYFGHPWPENPDPDPYPINPEDYCNYEPEHDNSPDDWDGGISVNVTVLPWDVKQASVTINASDLQSLY